MKQSREKRAAEIQDSIRQILYRDWDPIEISGHAPDDEYDSCIAPVYRILVGSRSEDELIACLQRLDFTGPPATSERGRLRQVARKLLDVDVKL